MANYTDAELKKIVRDVVREAKGSAHIETGYLKRSIRGDVVGKNRSLEFRQVVYGVYNNNSRLVQIAENLVPKDIQWEVILEDEEGNITQANGISRTGRKIKRSSISSSIGSTSKITALINQLRGKKKNDTGEGD